MLYLVLGGVNGIKNRKTLCFLNACSFSICDKIPPKSFTREILADMKPIFSGVCETFDAVLKEFDGEGDHVHRLVTYHPKTSVSKLVNSMKTASSRVIRKRGYESVKRALWGGHLWAPSYFAGSCGGASIDVVRRYIDAQKTPS
jgi:putative transposase